MADQQQMEEAKEIGKRTGRDPVIIAAMGSVLLAWYQYYVRGNKEHGMFIGLWPPTLLAFSNAVRINAINEKVESSAVDLFDRLTRR
jgi:tetrahydromethanopterin S-methyltransferase subunit G